MMSPAHHAAPSPRVWRLPAAVVFAGFIASTFVVAALGVAALVALAPSTPAGAGTAADPVGFGTLAVLLVATGLAGAIGNWR